MKIKSSVAGLIVAVSMVTLVVPTQAAWAMHHKHCTGKGWHMVSKSCNIKPAINWQHYESGVYTKPIVSKNMFMR